MGSTSIYFPALTCYKYKTDVSLSWNDALGMRIFSKSLHFQHMNKYKFLGLYGGIVNLFIGGSILSIFEVSIYLLTKKRNIKLPMKASKNFEYAN